MTPRLVFIRKCPALFCSIKYSFKRIGFALRYYQETLQSCQFFNEIESKPSGLCNSVYKSFKRKNIRQIGDTLPMSIEFSPKCQMAQKLQRV